MLAAALLGAVIGLVVLFVVVRAAVRSGMQGPKPAKVPTATHDGRTLDQWATDNRRRQA